MKKYLPAVFLLCFFEAVAFALWLGKNNIFYLFNFSYIGLSLFTGLVLYARRYAHSRRVVQLMVGLYMLVYLGLISGESMQLEGFFTTFSPVFLRPRPSITPWPKSSVLLSSAAAGAATPAGRPLSPIFCPSRCPPAIRAKGLAGCGTRLSRSRWRLYPHCSCPAQEGWSA